jgi:predicted transcriptional regulator
LRQLEKSLLQALNDAKGKILDDDSVITTLETLKQEAADISKKVEETDKVIGEIETVSQQYMPLSQVRVLLPVAVKNVVNMITPDDGLDLSRNML